MSSNIVVVKAANWSDFRTALRQLPAGPAGSSKRLFRGQADHKWKLLSAWERWLDLIASKREWGIENLSEMTREELDEYYHVSERTQRRFLDNFKRLAVGLPHLDTSKLQDDDAWWALGRHHGLMTPLLDWTESPYIAAFFATRDALFASNSDISSGGLMRGYNQPGPMAVWVLDFNFDELSSEAFRLVDARHDSFYRQRAQCGWFTRLTHQEHHDVEPFLTAVEKGALLKKIELDGSCAYDALVDLRQMNITASSLFPDLDGAAQEANLLSWSV